jgi:heat-inducible transcriptional repressor
VARFVLPGGTGSKQAPPRVQFRWGTVIVGGVMTSMSEELTLFSSRGVPLRETVMADADVAAMRTSINEKLGGQPLVDTPALIQALVEAAEPERRRAMAALAAVLLDTLIERTDERIALAGTANLTRAGVLDFHGSIRPILEALEEEVVLLKLIDCAAHEPLRVRIGDENEVEYLRGTSVVSTGYGPGTSVVGGMGVIGPTRMDYPATISVVSAVARYVGDVLAQN